MILHIQGPAIMNEKAVISYSRIVVHTLTAWSAFVFARIQCPTNALVFGTVDER